MPRPGRASWCTTRRRGYGDAGLTHLLKGALEDLEREGGQKVYYFYMLETGETGWRHAHVYLGNISRLKPSFVAGIFHGNGFGDTNVKVWDQARHSGYCSKSLDCSNHGYDESEWDTNVVWNKACRNQMKLARRHLDRLLTPSSDDSKALAA